MNNTIEVLLRQEVDVRTQEHKNPEVHNEKLLQKSRGRMNVHVR